MKNILNTVTRFYDFITRINKIAIKYRGFNLRHIQSKLLPYALLLSLTPFLSFCTDKKNCSKQNLYPKIRSEGHSEMYFGQKVEDKYRVLENSNNPLVKEWIKGENVLCDSIFNQMPFKDSIFNLMKNAIYSSKIRGGFPRVIGKKLFFCRNYIEEGAQKLFYMDSLNGQEIELFNTKSLHSNQTFNVDYFEPSFDGKYLAFGLSSTIEESTVIKIIDVSKKKLFPDSIPRTHFGTPFWLPNRDAFFYSQLKRIASPADSTSIYEDSKVKLHWIKTNGKNDQEILSREMGHGFKLDKLDFTSISASPFSDKVIAFTVHGSTPYNSLNFASVNDFSPNMNSKSVMWTKICDSNEKITHFTLNKDQLFVLSFKDNPNGSIKKIDVNKGMSSALTLLEGDGDVLEEMVGAKNYVFVKKLKNGISSIVRIDILNNKVADVDLLFNGYAYLVPPFYEIPPSYVNTDLLFFAMESWNREASIYAYDPFSEKIINTNLRPTGKYGDKNNIVAQELEVPTPDGQKIPLSVIYLKDTKMNGQNPTLLEGYGAYGISMSAKFHLPTLVWLQMGGIYAVAHVRGGGEKGYEWYKGGYKATKQNSWKDFIICAKFLIEKKFTSPEKLAAKGVSAGGVVAGRAITESPELFKAGILDVGELNTVRSEYSRNSTSITEFGSAKDSLEFSNLLKMDVYQHIKTDAKYPSLLITAGLNDTRVDWWQPAKAAARFQEASNGNMVLFYLNDFGHSGNPDRVKEETDFLSFLFYHLIYKGKKYDKCDANSTTK